MKAAAVVFLLVSYSTLISAMKITIAGREYVTGSCTSGQYPMCHGSYNDQGRKTSKTRQCSPGKGSCVGKAGEFCTVSLADDIVECPGSQGEAVVLEYERLVGQQSPAMQTDMQEGTPLGQQTQQQLWDQAARTAGGDTIVNSGPQNYGQGQQQPSGRRLLPKPGR
ncbi:hypothetical protein C1H76_0713 [Elsinoe australis]|uniref:Uncharacterized protein n=1 Tax=Elsinoe australis TaxID=40998 RepID=A0A4U7B7D5_9PEZI|nr:hypothetical protein C1H76_0713 [Elsinoe australis]